VAALLIGRRHRLRLIGTQTGGMHGPRAGTTGTARILTGSTGRVAATATTRLTGTAHERLAGANGTAIKRLAGRGRWTRRSTRTRRRRSSGTRHWPSLNLLLLLEPLN